MVIMQQRQNENCNFYKKKINMGWKLFLQRSLQYSRFHKNKSKVLRILALVNPEDSGLEIKLIIDNIQQIADAVQKGL